MPLAQSAAAVLVALDLLTLASLLVLCGYHYSHGCGAIDASSVAAWAFWTNQPRPSMYAASPLCPGRALAWYR
jgi:hypothetical protein